ncbi:GNAT family protein [Streptomyces sp. NPDC052051]|uniref:GNAT family N-acetyltransferase n=1 Tax=Streptomyces sp. NPDC052051 TaxID=3154649 RepID=UPI0034139FFB
MVGKLVRLKRMLPEHFEQLAQWASERSGAYSSASTDFVSGEELRDYSQQSGHQYLAVVTHDGAQLVGVVDYSQATYSGNYEIGINIGEPERWSSGYGADALGLLLRYLFHAKNAHRVQGVVGLYNKRSIQLVCTRGFTIEGLLRDYFFLDGSYHDGVAISMLRDDYYAVFCAEGNSDVDSVPAQERLQAREAVERLLSGETGRHLRAFLGRSEVPGT